jgi:hypothetical protein
MATTLKTQGITKDQRKVILTKFNMLAKSDFWHDFHKSYMQELLNNTSLTSSLSFKDRGSIIAGIRLSLKGDKSLADYFMGKMDGNILYAEKGKEGKSINEKNLLSSIGVKFETIEAALKKWNKNEKYNWGSLADIANLPVLPDITPTFETFNRNYSVKAVPVKAYEKNSFLPSVFEYQSGSGIKNFILMIDASILSITELGITGLVECIAGSYEEDHEYNFYFIQSNENDSDSATKLTNIENNTENVNIFFLRDEGHTSIYPVYDVANEDTNTNLYSLVGIQTVRTAENTITATLTGNVSQIVEDIGEISKLNKAAQKAVDSLIEDRGEITPNSLMYFLLKRAGDWCQALCLLDKTRVYTRYKQGTTADPDKTTLQEIIDEYNGSVVIALLTLDRVLLAYSFLLGIDVFFTTKYANLQPKKSGRSIHWSIFFKNKDTGMTPAQIALERKTILDKTATFLSKEGEFDTKKVELLATLTAFEVALEQFRVYVIASKDESFSSYLMNLYIYFYLKQNYIRTKEIEEIYTQLLNNLSKLKEFLAENDIESLRNELGNGKMIEEKMLSIESINTKLSEELIANSVLLPNADKFVSILEKIRVSIERPKATDFRKEISYNNFLEDIIKTLHQLIESCVQSGKVEVSSLGDLIKTDGFTLQFILGVEPTTSVSRKQNMMINYIKDAILSIFPNPLRGGFIYTPMTFDEFIPTLRRLFFKLRSRRILAYNYSKWIQVTNYKSIVIDDELFIGLKQAYVTDKEGNYFSILDNYIVTEEESQYFLLVEDRDKKTFDKHVKELDTNKKFELELLMYRYIIMRNRLYDCDRMYSKYLSLYYKYYEEINSLYLENPEVAHTMNEYENDLLSVELQRDISSLLENAKRIVTSMERDAVFLKINLLIKEDTFANKLENIFRSLSNIRLSIFSYSKRYYTPAIELRFVEYEAAFILMEFTGSNKEAIIEELEELRIKEILETSISTSSSEQKYTLAALERTTREELSKTSLTELANGTKDFQAETLNTMVELLDNQTRLQSLVDSAAAAVPLSEGGGGLKRKRKTKKKGIKRTSKRTSRKH